MRKILVVSDDSEFGSTISTFLGPEFDVRSAGCCRDLMPLLRREQPTMIIADVAAPESEEARHLGMVRILNPDLPIIIVSFYADELSRFSQGGRRVASALFPKPFNNDLLADAVTLLSDRKPERGTWVQEATG